MVRTWLVHELSSPRAAVRNHGRCQCRPSLLALDVDDQLMNSNREGPLGFFLPLGDVQGSPLRRVLQYIQLASCQSGSITPVRMCEGRQSSRPVPYGGTPHRTGKRPPAVYGHSETPQQEPTEAPAWPQAGP